MAVLLAKLSSCQTPGSSETDAALTSSTAVQAQPDTQSIRPPYAPGYRGPYAEDGLEGDAGNLGSLGRQCDHAELYAALARHRSNPPSVAGTVSFGDLHGLPVDYNEEVEKWIRIYTKRDGATLRDGMVRAMPYMQIIRDALNEEQVPDVMFYVALIESGFRYSARSPKAAAGPWQFMRGTAQLYGLTVDPWIDERHDPIASTHAAARLFKNLYSEFQDWYLALAAYNAGPGRISKALRKAPARSYWGISRGQSLVRRETREYVPKLLAAILISENPAAFGLGWEGGQLDPEAAPPYSYIELDRPIELAALEQKLMVSPGTIRKWNPNILRQVTPPTASKARPFRLRIHQDYSFQAGAAVSALPAFKVDVIKTHTIASGETLGKIARRYGIQMRSILKLNPGVSERRLRIGKVLMIPMMHAALAGSPEAAR